MGGAPVIHKIVKPPQQYSSFKQGRRRAPSLRSGFVRDAGDGGPFLHYMLGAIIHFAESSPKLKHGLKGDVEPDVVFKEDGDGVVAAAGGELDPAHRPALHVREFNKVGVCLLAFNQTPAAYGF